MTNDIATYLKYANLQMAAEALFDRQPAEPGTIYFGKIEPEVLTLGNNRASKFTTTQATEFASLWEVVEHISNTPTGFSGTLFKAKSGGGSEIDALRTKYGITAGELTLSFRSTEFADDAARDNQATNNLEIKATGWAFGQIADMQAWYQRLRETYSTDFARAGGKFAVTGYSLGGHLAAAFDLLRTEDNTFNARVSSTYTFNGAGVGKLNPGATLTGVMAQFTNRRAFLSNTDLFVTQQGRALYQSIAGIFHENALVNTVEVRSAITRINTLAAVGNALNALEVVDDANRLFEAMNRVSLLLEEAERINTGIASGSASGPALPVITSAIAAAALDYQLAVLQASQQTQSYGSIDAVAKAIDDTLRSTEGRSNVFDIYGDASPSMVSNSQKHLGISTPIWIEDQPLLRGNYISAVTQASTLVLTDLANGIKLLAPGFSSNDFGDTHSLVLLVDSLMVQNALCQLDSTLGETANRVKLKALLNAASNTSALSSASVLSGVNQGKADGDTLEALVNALGTYLGINPGTSNPDTSNPATSWTQLKGNPNGGTWAVTDPAATSEYTGRTALHNNLKMIADDADYKALLGKVTVEAVSALAAPEVLAKKLATLAKTDFGVIAALEALSPFMLKARESTDGQSKLDSLWQGAWSEQYKGWKDDEADRGVVLSVPTGAVRYYSDNWLADRSAMLEKLIELNTLNIDPQETDRTRPSHTSAVDGKAVDFEDRYTGIKFTAGVQPLLPSSQLKYLFGSDDAETDLVGRAGEDHIYAGGGDDRIDGGAGDDKLYGDAGEDSIQGGDGIDEIHGGEGNDGKVNGAEGNDTALDGGADNDIIFGEAGNDRLLGGTGADTLYGDAKDPDNASAIGDDTLIGGDGIDTLYGGQGDDTLYGDQATPASVEAAGFGWGDKLYGGKGKDTLYGGSGNDMLDGGEGDDTLTGGDGNDQLLGGAGKDTYQFDGYWGKDTITDSDGKGSISIDGVTLGYGVANGKGWAFDLGGGVYAGMAVYDDATSSTGKKLIITKGAGTANTVIVNNFDYAATTTGAGYLGITLDNTPKVALIAGAIASGASFWKQIGASIDSLAGQAASLSVRYQSAECATSNTVDLTVKDAGEMENTAPSAVQGLARSPCMHTVKQARHYKNRSCSRNILLVCRPKVTGK
jgi:hypothetical protein